MITKICTKCKEEFPLDGFSKHNTAKYGRNSICKKCETKRVVEWQRKNPDRVRARAKKFSDKPSTKKYRKDWALQKYYGLTPEAYESIKERQNGTCGICGKHSTLHVDHDHTTGLVRGLLCGSCNRALGLFKDSVAHLQSAILYLESNLADN